MKKIIPAFCLFCLILCAAILSASAASNPLKYELLEDGSGYMITGCEDNSTLVSIPAKHNGLPVKAIADRAFTECRNNAMFVVSKDSEYFYSSDGVLFTDYPVKTLVRFPNNWQIEELSAYQIPEGTEVIAPWAFSGIHTLGYLHIPESVHTIGDYAFAEAEVYYMLRIYATDSVTTIGKDLFKKIKGYTEIYANPDSAIWQYAQKNRIDCKEYISYQPREKTITTGEPDLTEAEDPWGSGRKKRVILPVFGSDYIGDTLQLYYDLTELQEMEHDEVYIPVGNRWPDILPDKNGKTNNGYPASEGLFGVGYTEGVTILRGYDQEGEICGVRQAEGDFTFALPGAVTIGVSGGKGTHLSLVPYQPVYVEKPGTLPLTEDVFRQSTRMHPFQILLLDYPSPHWSIKCPEHLNVVTAITADAFGMTSNEATGRKTILTLSVKDTYLADQLDQVSFHFHSADRTLENGQLTFALLKDKSGYEITQCSEDAVVAVIPATYEGLPVKSIANRAFVNCPLLEEYTVTDDSDLYYTEDGVLFTDEPVRTLVRFPNHWRGERINAYMVPEGTKAIAPWAFSGNNDSLTDLHIPEGVTTLGDCAFAESVLYASLYAPDSLTKIGKKLTQNMKGSVAVYANKGAAALKYASSQHIPCNSYTEQDVPEKTVQIGEADLTDAGNLNPPDPDRRAVYEIEDDLRFFLSAMQEVYDLTELQQDDPSEVYIPMGRRWPMLQPDAEGKTADGYIPQEGVYGVGYTNGEATLRGYDAEGNVTGIRRVEGDFVFALPGAVDFGVSGGDGTRLSIIPYEPVVITGPGSLPLSPEEFRSGENGMPFLAYALAYDYPVASASFPSYLNTLSSCPTDAFGTPFGTSGHYVLLVKQMNDPYLMDRMNEYALVFHTLEKQFENKEITVRASTQYAGDMDEDLGNKIWECFRKDKELMEGIHYPAGAALYHVNYDLNGQYPSADTFDDGDCRINLDEYCLKYKEAALTFLHETVHAIDLSFVNVHKIAPQTWLEGRAEYISYKAAKEMKIRTSGYSKRYNWSFLSDEDKADFFRYYYESTNRETTYPVGYYFFCYLCDTYGEDVSAKITENIINARYNDYNRMEVFKECVTSATDPDVFQNFVRDVIK